MSPTGSNSVPCAENEIVSPGTSAIGNSTSNALNVCVSLRPGSKKNATHVPFTPTRNSHSSSPSVGSRPTMASMTRSSTNRICSLRNGPMPSIWNGWDVRDEPEVAEDRDVDQILSSSLKSASLSPASSSCSRSRSFFSAGESRSVRRMRTLFSAIRTA